ncbi:lipase family protein [Asticcacaulis benevestitus]|uniref:Lipase n=1 Tax=Asticcacaulis benevestitus DSM 16100 = ATCC BAA-896 TaxID=1121022 RepID=V4RGN2_9CAUL|nr:lipase family protein [Asticcacaulis benevestitus]ESQ90508.1 hypothetical protein ABENE_12360 [Asticcacaulis benevestitus DSM 16100 = ATCC BAA-896]
MTVMSLRNLVRLGTLVFAGTGLVVCANANPLYGDGGVSPFYSWSQAVPAVPGTVLRKEPLSKKAYPHANSAERLLYVSTDGIDSKTPIVVSGQIYLPIGKAPKGGWPIMTWGHPTVGVADVCAPSWTGYSAPEALMVDTWLAAGFAVVATDYQGLGTEGPHPYLLFRPEGYGVLDAARAALKAYPGQVANKIIPAGFSQGSGAALGAAWLAPTYAPDLKVLGAVATGLVVETSYPGPAPQVEGPAFTGDDGGPETAFQMLFLIGTAPALDSAFDPKAVLLKAGEPLLKTAQTGCFDAVIGQAMANKLDYREQAGTTNIYDPAYEATIHKIEVTSPFDNARFTMPILTLTGLADEPAPISRQYNFISAMCTAGSTVEWHYYPHQTHSSTVNTSLPEALRFAKALSDGQAVSGNCADLVPPGPTQTPDPALTHN